MDPGTARCILLPLSVGLALLVSPDAARSQSPRLQDDPVPSAPGAAGRSMILPGWGQLELGQRRGWAYAVAEAALWVVWADRRSAARDLRDQYRDFAWQKARLQANPRVDGPFSYYEHLSNWLRSGAFDVDPGTAGVQPEDDVSTYNGSIWARARQLFFPSGAQAPPGSGSYVQALGYYRERAYGDAFLWDWTGGEADQVTYGALIVASDDRFKQATTAFGAVLANHLLSGVDAYISARLRHSAALRVDPAAAWASGNRWNVTLRLDRIR
jgi:hypothetical protein